MPRCLILERHQWETGGRQQQIQIPLAALRAFFPGGSAALVRLRPRIQLFDPRAAQTPVRVGTALVSKYRNSQTCRFNSIPEVGHLPACYLFIMESRANPLSYDIWWNPDRRSVERRFGPMNEARASQYGRGRRWTIVNARVSRTDPN